MMPNHRRSILATVLVLVIATIGCGRSNNGPDTGLDAGDTGPTDTRPDGDADGGLETREVGESCDAPEQCVEGSSCIGNPDGEYTCMNYCDDVWTFCENGSVCTPVANGSPICYTGGTSDRRSRCQSNLDCQSGLLCVGVPDETHYCLGACHAEEGGCGDHQRCKPFGSSGKGYCRHVVGDRCSGSNNCADALTCSSTLAPAVRQKFPGGYCTTSGCESDGDCPGEAVCRTYPDTSISMCFGPCEDDPDCRLTDRYACLDKQFCDVSSGGAGKCNAFRDGADFCVPTDLQSWDDR